VIKRPYPKRFLRNTKSNEVHDTRNEQKGCQLNEILDEHARWYDTKQQALDSTSDANPCHYCIG
jgi:hypothetical protein